MHIRYYYWLYEFEADQLIKETFQALADDPHCNWEGDGLPRNENEWRSFASQLILNLHPEKAQFRGDAKRQIPLEQIMEDLIEVARLKRSEGLTQNAAVKRVYADRGGKLNSNKTKFQRQKKKYDVHRKSLEALDIASLALKQFHPNLEESIKTLPIVYDLYNFGIIKALDDGAEECNLIARLINLADLVGVITIMAQTQNNIDALITEANTVLELGNQEKTVALTDKIRSKLLKA